MSVLFMTGAGISASAGIPTYRDGGSSWRDKDLEKKSQHNRYGNHLDELWDKHWGPIGRTMAMSHPTAAHVAIADFQKKHPAIVATQNIDNLHEQAGSDNIYHAHGNMTIKCIRCKQTDLQTSWTGNGAPVCPHCNSKKTRPDVVLFGEPLNNKAFSGIEKFARGVSHIIVVGTSLNVFPFAGLAMDNFSNPSIKTILVNKSVTPFNKYFDVVINGSADAYLEEVLFHVDKEIGELN